MLRLFLCWGEMNDSRPTRERLTAIALRILEDALAQGNHGPVRGTLAHQLALAWLAYEKIGLDWHYRNFWQEMAAEGSKDTYKNYFRTTTLTGLLNHWYGQLGWPAPSVVERGEWAKAYDRRPAQEEQLPSRP